MSLANRLGLVAVVVTLSGCGGSSSFPAAPSISGDFTGRPTELCAAPGSPVNLIVVSGSSGHGMLRWNAGSGSLRSYVFEAGSASGLLNVAHREIGLSTTFAVPGFGPGTYFMRVRASNACGISAASNEVRVIVFSAAPPLAPPAPALTPTPIPIP